MPFLIATNPRDHPFARICGARLGVFAWSAIVYTIRVINESVRRVAYPVLNNPFMKLIMIDAPLFETVSFFNKNELVFFYFLNRVRMSSMMS